MCLDDMNRSCVAIEVDDRFKEIVGQGDAVPPILTPPPVTPPVVLQPAVPTRTFPLAATGVDAEAFGSAGLLMLLLGAGFLMLGARRRRTNAGSQTT
ncbi:hypothetical protein EH165_02665 [Nakamurella antarctica]|uniref:Uncharacterized protein n=1 Tax=Nakamurella antarctica TaxID=1902245 RepID=A0A3G8ZIR7_9ACTN|nr:hypothetical protein [Nakamurella antarctica]AZI57223.1 hypothetical protein EH165_02665 [Nakamurella antarctica]